ncbi:MAG: hypothetical protein VW397_04275 [Candidatus Margulisiibacteriota bacterium]
MTFKYKIFLFILLSSYLFAVPEIILERPKNENMTVYQSKVKFKGIVKNGLDLTINGLKIPLTVSGGFDYTVNLSSKNGNNYFLLEASDGTNKTQLSRTIFYSEENQKKGKKETIRKTESQTTQPMKKIQQNYSEELNKIERLEALRSYIGKNSRGSYAFSEIKLNDFINIFAKEHKVNIINNTESTKTLTVELIDMHPADVFNTLINYWGCNWMMKDNVIRIIKQAPIRVYKLNYLQGSEFIQLITGLSNITQFKTNPIDNSIIAQGATEDLDYLESLIKELDIKPKQVLIEATIIETNFDISNILGTNPTAIHKTVQSPISPFNLQTLGYTFSMSAFENNSNVNILANPQILVTNHKTAFINTGNQTGYTTTTVTETSTIQNMNFLNTGITLEITPHISDTGEILMELNPSISEGQVNQNKPISSKTSTKTQVIIRDGETIVIGGLIQKKKTRVENKVPFFSNLPIINLFLAQEEITEKKMELSVLITPHIIKESSELIDKTINSNEKE